MGSSSNRGSDLNRYRKVGDPQVPSRLARGFPAFLRAARQRAARMRRTHPDMYSTNPFKQDYSRGGPDAAGAHKGMP